MILSRSLLQIQKEEKEPYHDGIGQQSIGDSRQRRVFGQTIDKSHGRPFHGLRNTCLLRVKKGKDSFYERRINLLLG